jgi:hypothetical protein
MRIAEALLMPIQIADVCQNTSTTLHAPNSIGRMRLRVPLVTLPYQLLRSSTRNAYGSESTFSPAWDTKVAGFTSEAATSRTGMLSSQDD